MLGTPGFTGVCINEWECGAVLAALSLRGTAGPRFPVGWIPGIGPSDRSRFKAS